MIQQTIERKIVDYRDRLRLLTISATNPEGDLGLGAPVLDPKTAALLRLAALVAVGGAVASYAVQADEAAGAGATTAELVDVLVAVIPIVGLPRAVAAAPTLALALGYDTDGGRDEARRRNR